MPTEGLEYLMLRRAQILAPRVLSFLLAALVGLSALSLGPSLLRGEPQADQSRGDSYLVYYFGDTPYSFPRELMRGPGGHTSVVEGRNDSTVLWGLAGWDFVSRDRAPPGAPTWSLMTESSNFKGPQATRIQGVWAHTHEDHMMAAAKGAYDNVTQYLDVEAGLLRPREGVLVTQEFGLYRFQRGDSGFNSERYDVIYQDTTDGIPKTLIECNQGSSWRGYGCRHWFVHNGVVRTKAYYDYEHLHAWARVEEEVRKRLDEFAERAQALQP